jgi:hypothetical protein
MKNSLFILALLLSSVAFAQVPFNRDKQPAPTGADWNSMIPSKLGSFDRIAFQLPEPGNDGAAYYKKGKQIVYLSFTRLNGEKQIDEYMKVAKGDVMRSTAEIHKSEFSGETRYVYYRQKDKAFFAWTRGNYYFDVMVEGDVAAMDEFMNLFSY